MPVTSPVSARLTVTGLLLLTFATGIIDAISVLVLGHVFVANMTGNVIFWSCLDRRRHAQVVGAVCPRASRSAIVRDSSCSTGR